MPMVQKWLHMMVRRGQYRRLRRWTVWWQARRRGTLARRRVAGMIEEMGGRKALRAKAKGAGYGAGGGVTVVPGSAGGWALPEEEEPQTAEEKELAEEIERMKAGAAPTLGQGAAGRSTRGVLDLMGEEEEKLLMAESEMEVSLPELLDPKQLQELLQGQDYHMMETEIEVRPSPALARSRPISRAAAERRRTSRNLARSRRRCCSRRRRRRGCESGSG